MVTLQMFANVKTPSFVPSDPWTTIATKFVYDDI